MLRDFLGFFDFLEIILGFWKDLRDFLGIWDLKDF